ncbi:GNAT family N-acetyltransferase [Sphingomonas soli]|uniref:GNAT family N-acetyltransferase n=1 Tax=Sphingomonas soli TaxID=266127 RepID=UPI0008342E40|nr:GNAT family N-acetyltransferase [Sphingomonas soli]
MYVSEVQLEPDAIAVACHPGVPDEMDQLVESLPPPYQFLRAAWYRAAAADRGTTLIGTRADGTTIAAIPTIGFGNTLIGGRNIPGSYWPFRSIPIDPSAEDSELAEMLGNPLTMEMLGQVWRIGPIYSDDPATTRIKRAAAMAGWTVLVRRLGRTFLFDLADGWPRSTTKRRLNKYMRQLEQQGDVRFEMIRGADWNAGVLETLCKIEMASWVGRATDGTGAKFLSEDRRAEWLRVLADPALAEALTATILYVGDHPVAFSFDLMAAPLQYSIACSYDARFSSFRPGKLVTAHQLQIARDLGVEQVDFGAGDSGYKREMGAVRGPEILDLLIVRRRSAASLLRLKWGSESAIARDSYLAAARLRNVGRETFPRLEAMLAIGAIAAAALTFVE